MSATTPEMEWPLLVGLAPLAGAAFLLWDAAQGPAGAASSPAAGLLLAAVAALGTGVACWRAWQSRRSVGVSVAQAAALSAARARAGAAPPTVLLRGHARPLPDAVPLVSPDGELCLWHGGAGASSTRPFLLADDSGACLLLPAGAQVTGHGPVPLASTARGAERLLREGDRIEVVGRLVAAVPPFAPRGLPMPVVCAPAAGQPLGIRIGVDDGAGAVYGLLAVVDGLVLVVSASLVAWPALA